jgi:uncharacterized protein YjbI with pentapeptide repeats
MTVCFRCIKAQPCGDCGESTMLKWVLLISLALGTANATAADVTAREITDQLFRANDAAPVSFAGKNLSFLDLAGLRFKKADLSGVNLNGADLSASDLSGSNLAGANLDNTNLARANFSGANLKSATLMTVTAHLTAEPNPADAPKFIGANLAGAKIAARLDGADFRNADLTRAVLGQMIATWGSYRPRAVLIAANFSGATLLEADLSKGMFRFARFNDANLTGANLHDCDFTKADFSGADLTGADVSGADFDGAELASIKGLDAAIGLDMAKNLVRASN